MAGVLRCPSSRLHSKPSPAHLQAILCAGRARQAVSLLRTVGKGNEPDPLLPQQKNERGAHSSHAHQGDLTIANLDGSDLIDMPHIAEALQYRTRKGDLADSSRIQRLGCVSGCRRCL